MLHQDFSTPECPKKSLKELCLTQQRTFSHFVMKNLNTHNLTIIKEISIN